MADVLTSSDEVWCDSGEKSSVDLSDIDDVLNDNGIIRGHQFQPYTEDTVEDDVETSDEEEADLAEVRRERRTIFSDIGTATKTGMLRMMGAFPLSGLT